jgi:hypothetical protein
MKGRTMPDQPLNWLDDDQPTPGQERPRYVIAGEENGTWSVYDRLTNLPAVLDENMLVELTFEAADDMLELMNALDAEEKRRGLRAT